MSAARYRTVGRLLAGITISALLLYLTLRQVDVAELVRSAERLGASSLALAVLGMVFHFLMGTVRVTTALARVSGTALPAAEVVRHWFPMTLATVLLGHVVSIAADAVRLPHMMRRHGLSLGASVGLLAFDRVVGFGSAFLLSVFSSAFVLWPHLVGRFIVEISILLAMGLAIGLLVFTLRVTRLLIGHPRFRTLVRTYFGSAKRVLEQVTIAVLACVGLALAIIAAATAIGAHVPAGVALAAAPIVYCGASIPFTFAGWGSREVSMIAALSWSGWTSTNDAVLVSLAIGVATLIASLPGVGFVWRALSDAERASGSGRKP